MRHLPVSPIPEAKDSYVRGNPDLMVLVDTERAARKVPRRDTALQHWVRALEATAPIAAEPRRLLLDLIAEQAQKRPDALALISAEERLTYGALVRHANAYARWALSHSIAKGDTVGLLMPNRPEYLAIWLGLSRAGIVVALLNTQLRGASLAHCIEVAAPKHIIAAAEFSEEVRAASAHLKQSPKIWLHGGDGSFPAFDRIDRAIEELDEEQTRAAERRDVTVADPALLIYTSGTTGLPKAAYVSHRRLLQWSLWFAGLMDTGPDDRMYDCLPFYHSVGGVVATGALLVRGGSVLIREKFSARTFWDDVVDGGCTLFQYIGELCRYLLNAPDDPKERGHRLRLACGNGLSADVWEEFQDRFAIPRILEFYAATEGNVSLYNVEGKAGAIGRIPSYLAHRFPLALVKFNVETGAPVRDERGFCIRCAAGEAGEALARIGDGKSDAGAAFEGYTDAAASEQKVLRDVFARGDAWYRTGDLMRLDKSGFYYFVDRIGDTFRWKGENVSTAEVSAAITAFPGISEAAVYGVHVPGTEGAAGMAAVVTGGELDLREFRRHLVRALPSYARPLFVRVTGSIGATATFKQIKAGLARDAFDPAATSDPIYFDDAALKAFVPLDSALYALITTGDVRV